MWYDFIPFIQVDVETEEEAEDEEEGTIVEAGEEEEEEEEEEPPLKASPDADTTLLFTTNSEKGRVQTRAVVFRLFQKTVILPPNPVGFRLTYTQL